MNLESLVSELASRGVSLTAYPEEDRINAKPSGVVTPELGRWIKAYKPQLMQRLRGGQPLHPTPSTNGRWSQADEKPETPETRTSKTSKTRPSHAEITEALRYGRAPGEAYARWLQNECKFQHVAREVMKFCGADPQNWLAALEDILAAVEGLADSGEAQEDNDDSGLAAVSSKFSLRSGVSQRCEDAS